MILFVGAEDRGFFVKETAMIRKEELQFIEENNKIAKQIDRILNVTCEYIIFDIEQYVDQAELLAVEIQKIRRAKNCDVIIYAPGYDRRSKIIQELMLQGIQYYVFSGNAGEAKEELERCLQGYFDDPVVEEISEKKENTRLGTKIGITGACRRIGTTTFAIQFVKYLQLKGYKACYIEVNDTGFVQKHEENFNCESHDVFLGKVVFADVDMYYRQETLLEVLKQDYDYFVYDFGTYTDAGFNKTSFLEKEIRIFVAGSKASEIDSTMDVLQNEYYTDVFYIFNFISENEKKDLLEFMEEKAEQTFFTVYTPDQFEYVYNQAFEKILPVEDVQELNEKRGLFGRKKKRK